MDPPDKKYFQKMQTLKRYQTEFEWILPDWFLQYDDFYSKGVASNYFELEGTNGCLCQLCLTPMDPEGHLSIKLSDSASIVAMNLIILTNIQNRNEYDFYKPRFPSCRLHMSVPCKEKKMPHALDKESLTILAKFVIVSLPNPSICEKPSLDISKKPKVPFRADAPCDITFVLGDKTLSAHKHVIAAQSIVFQRMFLSPLTERENTRVQILDINPKVFEEFINYLYTGEINNFNNIVEDVIVVASKYQVKELKTLCENFMLQHLNVQNVVKFIFMADKLRCPELKQEAVKFLKNSASTLTKVIEEENIEAIKGLKKIFCNNSSEN